MNKKMCSKEFKRINKYLLKAFLVTGIVGFIFLGVSDFTGCALFKSGATTANIQSAQLQLTTAYEEVGSNIEAIYTQWQDLRNKNVVTDDQNIQFQKYYKVAYDGYVKAGALLKIANSTSSSVQNIKDYNSAITVAGNAFRDILTFVMTIKSSK
jgi:hypothetical protein